jgi:hypothetical protein
VSTTPALTPDGSAGPAGQGPNGQPTEPPPAAGAAQPAPDAAGADAELGAVEALPRALKVIGSVVAPTTLVTALLFYFGQAHVQGLFRYLRVPYTLFAFTPQDYLFRSADGLLVPLAGAAVLALVVLWANRLLVGRLREAESSRGLRLATPIIALVGAGLTAFAVVAANDPAAFVTVPELPGLALAAGVLLLAYAVRLWRLRRPGRPPAPPSMIVTEWAVLFLVVSVGLFWAVGNYAIGVGVTRGQEIARLLPATPDAVVFSENRLNLAGPGVAELECGPEESAYRFRYSGLKLVFQSGDQLLLLPAEWTRTSGAAMVLPRTDSIRLEFSGPGSTSGGTC